MDYELRRSRRRTASIEVGRDGSVLVRAPLWMPQRDVDALLRSHAAWIQARQAEQAARRAAYPEPDAAAEQRLRRMAAEQLPPLVAYWSRQMGVQPTGLRITSARTRHGSCSAKNSLCFSWRLMQYPPEAVEAVVVHELAHIRHKNHGAAFYAEVERYLPDDRQRAALLRGPALANREEKTQR